jgi:Mg-chelatase subunit ChlD
MDFAAYSLPAAAAASAPATEQILVQIRGKLRPAEERPPVHFIAVLDRSGSMGSADRLTNCLDSLRFLTRFLTAADRLSLITFNNVARVCMAAMPMDAAGAATLEANLHVVADGGTSISGAIACIEECLAAAAAANVVTKTGILFLTDGHANEGVTDPTSLQQMLRGILGRAASPTASVSTIGYGCDHNISLLQGMAEQNAGSYNVVVDRENVATVFGHLLGGLMSCVASNVRINAPIETTALPASLQMTHALDGIDICVGDIYSETTTEVLLTARAGLSELLVRSYDITSGASMCNTVPVVAATEAEIKQATIFRLRQDVAALLHDVAGARQATPALLDRIAALQNNCMNLGADPVIAMLNRQLGEAADVLRRGALNAEARTLIAQNSAYTQMGRGLRATVSAAATVEADSWADEDPFSSPVMRVVSGITATLSRSAAEPATPSFGRQVAGSSALSYMQVSPAVHSPLMAPPPLYRMQYAIHLGTDDAAASADALLPIPTSPLARQIAAASRQTSNNSNEMMALQPQRLAFNSPLLTGAIPPESIPAIAID